MRNPKILHDEMIVVDGHNHFMIGLDPIRTIGNSGVFASHYAPVFKKGGVNVVLAVVGGDTPSCCAFSDNLLWGTLRVMNSLLHESERQRHACMQNLQRDYRNSLPRKSSLHHGN